MAGRRDERVGDAAAHDERVDHAGERIEHVQLRRYLRPGDDRHEGPRRGRQRLAEGLELPGE